MTQAPTSRKHVFAVNHSPEFLDVLRELLGDEHYRVTVGTFDCCTADDVAEAHPDLLLVDIAPVDDLGLPFLEQVRQNPLTMRLPVVVLSTSPHLIERLDSQADWHGTGWFLRKPVDLNDLLEAIAVMIGPATPA